MPQQEEHLRDYLQLIRKHDFTICLSVLLVLGTALIISLRLPKTYAASTLMLFVQPSATSSLPSANLFQNVFSGGIDRREMETISTRFSTESMLNTAIENLEENGYAEAAALFPPVGKLKRMLKAQVNPDSDYITLSLALTEAEGVNGTQHSSSTNLQAICKYCDLETKKRNSKNVWNSLEINNRKL